MKYNSSRAPLLPRLLEITQIRRRLVLEGRHQLAIGRVDHIGLAADLDPNIVRRAGLHSPHRAGIGLAENLLEPAVGPRQGMVQYDDIVIKDVAFALVEIEPLPDDGLIVVVKRDAGSLVGARAAQKPGVDFERRVLAVAIFVDP